MKILAVETCTEACSVALLSENGLQERYKLAPREHTELVLPMTQELLQEAGLELRDLDAIAVSIGPGAFTGVRVGLSMAQGLALPHELPLVGINTLEAMAWRHLRKHPSDKVGCCLDARMGEVYFASYSRSEITFDELQSPLICSPDQLSEQLGEDSPAMDILLGHGLLTYPEIQNMFNCDHVDKDVLPRAGDVARLARLYHPHWENYPATPLYLRNNVAKKSSKPLF